MFKLALKTVSTRSILLSSNRSRSIPLFNSIPKIISNSNISITRNYATSQEGADVFTRLTKKIEENPSVC